MNTRGPSGGRGARSQAKTGSPTARATGYTAKAGQQRGDSASSPSRNLSGQMPPRSRISKVRQASVNSGPMTDFSVSAQNLTATKGLPKQAPVNSGAAVNRHTQNSMSKGNKSE